ncbi:hypothetical protein DF3PA_200016 [Candidatus Defluviicoccus seviourii]|uniref:Uncharacterized protein n=1 Tax=Candidatus Defluviicoccus seviourii TaxID=2565273 RepID=A0A564WFS6_9PROT|nr:hypothetical protein DF3PA_200016 [Candidatus Defluviicoccus seviourii]
MTRLFDATTFYQHYSRTILSRPGYPARAQYKSTIMWDIFGAKLVHALGSIETYADIGGAFGFSANCLRFHISNAQKGTAPKTFVFELTDDYDLCSLLFPEITYVAQDISTYDGVFDLVTCFDVIEHISDPASFLEAAASKARFALTMTPLETTGDWRGGRRVGDAFGDSHPEGHVNFFNIRSYHALLSDSPFRFVAETSYMISLKPRFAIDDRGFYPESSCSPYSTDTLYEKIKCPAKYIVREFFPASLYRRLFGGCWALNLLRSTSVT